MKALLGLVVITHAEVSNYAAQKMQMGHIAVVVLILILFEDAKLLTTGGIFLTRELMKSYHSLKQS